VRGGGYMRAKNRVTPDQVLSELLAPRVAACAKGYQLDRYSIDIHLETTGVEIVDVAVTGSDNASFTRCVAEGAWQLALWQMFAAERDFRVRISSER